MNINHNHHGGECCGRWHLYGFEPSDDDDDDVAGVYDDGLNLSSYQDALQNYRRGTCCEVVLTGWQVRNAYFSDGTRVHDQLIADGFENVYSFTNPNSSNDCHVYLFSAAKIPPVPDEQELPDRPELRVVHSDYHGHFIDGELSRPYINELAARQALPRCRRFVRRDVWSDGTIKLEAIDI